MNDKVVTWITVAMLLAVGAFFGLVDRIPQNPAYHQFADSRTILGIPHFWNVVSNLPFIVVGVWGLQVVRARSDDQLHDQRRPFTVLFAGVVLTAFGSCWYHAAPENQTLFWDRLPMILGFAGLFTAVIGIYLSRAAARALLAPFIAAGAIATLYWFWTETRGVGDLRPYAVVQFLPIIALPFVLLLRGNRSPLTPWLWLMLANYALSKLFEWFDAPIYAATGISGHSLKHLFAAIAVGVLVQGLRQESREEGLAHA